MDKHLSINVNDLSLKFKQDESYLLHKASFSFKSGQITILRGANGSGKSTLIKFMLKLLEQKNFSEVSGTIKGVTEENLGFMHQRPSTQILTFTVEEELASPLSFRKIPRKTRWKIINNLAKQYKITDLFGKSPNNLSAGQLQLVIALTNFTFTKNFLLLDEPFALLDKKNRTRFVEGIISLKKNNVGILIATHKDYILGNEVDSVLEIKNQKITPALPFTKPEIKFKPTTSEQFSKHLSFPNVIMGYRDPILQFPVLTLPENGIAIITGSNGSGKTLFLLTLSKILKPLSGKIKLKDNLFIPQDSTTFFWRKSIQEEWNQHTNQQLPEQFRKKAKMSPYLLSQGEAKEFVLELALKFKGNIMLDEPSYALDLNKMHKFVKNLLNVKNRMVVLSSNDDLFLTSLSNSKLDYHAIHLQNYQAKVN